MLYPPHHVRPTQTGIGLAIRLFLNTLFHIRRHPDRKRRARNCCGCDPNDARAEATVARAHFPAAPAWEAAAPTHRPAARRTTACADATAVRADATARPIEKAPPTPTAGALRPLICDKGAGLGRCSRGTSEHVDHSGRVPLAQKRITPPSDPAGMTGLYMKRLPPYTRPMSTLHQSSRRRYGEYRGHLRRLRKGDPEAVAAQEARDVELRGPEHRPIREHKRRAERGERARSFMDLLRALLGFHLGASHDDGAVAGGVDGGVAAGAGPAVWHQAGDRQRCWATSRSRSGSRTCWGPSRRAKRGCCGPCVWG